MTACADQLQSVPLRPPIPGSSRSGRTQRQGGSAVQQRLAAFRPPLDQIRVWRGTSISRALFTAKGRSGAWKFRTRFGGKRFCQPAPLPPDGLELIPTETSCQPPDGTDRTPTGDCVADGNLPDGRFLGTRYEP